ncbi:MAG: hypothetical protein CH104c_0413 [Candidatus Woesebacteria bacterium]|nr:MAG: hypothetical protein CH104c_0413 [Candidatus Woesebacteria bacterium]
MRDGSSFSFKEQIKELPSSLFLFEKVNLKHSKKALVNCRLTFFYPKISCCVSFLAN